MTDRITVFGGSGFLGSHVCEKLASYGYSVRNFDLRPSPVTASGLDFMQGDILDSDAVKKAIGDASIVYNFAGHADLDTASVDPIRTTELNVLGNLNIVDACKELGVSQFIYASTIYVFSESGGFYRCSKQAAETYIEEYNRRFNLNYTILRYGSLYGPRADSRNSIYRYIEQALKHGTITVNGTGNEVREYIHVRDAAKVSTKVINPEFYNKRFVITGHQGMPVKRMISMISEILRNKVEIVYEPRSDTDHYNITPYSFVPKVGEKFAPDIFVDMGQGLIECMADIMKEIEARV